MFSFGLYRENQEKKNMHVIICTLFVCLTCLHIYLYDVMGYEWYTRSHDSVGYMRFVISYEIIFGICTLEICASVLLVVVPIKEIFNVS